jgi:hypothetical protein
MHRPTQRSTRRSRRRNKRIAAAAIVLVAFGALAAVTQVSSAKTRNVSGSVQCGPSVPGATGPDGQDDTATQQNGRTVWNHWGDGQQAAAGCPSDGQQAVSTQANGGAQKVNCPTVPDKLPNVPAAARGEVDLHLTRLDALIADANNRLAAVKGQANNEKAVLDQMNSQRAQSVDRIAAALSRAGVKAQGLNGLKACTLAAAANNGGNANGGKNNGGNANAGNNGGKNNNNAGKLQILADTCGNGGSKLTLHDGFQKPNRCVKTEMGEVGAANNNPSLLITQAPQQVKAGQAFQIRVSTRNLIRDRFLAAGQGGYYLEMSKLNAQGLVRGHFHTACRMLDNTNAAPDPAPAPAFFVATEDNGGSNKPDEIVINVTGLPNKGTAQCASWAGDGSHRIPMMERANQTPAFDAVRITVN